MRSWRLPRSAAPELLDRPGHDGRLLAANLADMGRANRWLGGVWLVRRSLDRLTRDLRPGVSLSVLDVASGGADIPRALPAWGARRGFRVKVVASDLSLEIARLAVTGWPAAAPRYIVADARRLPFADRSVDLVVCSFALHHFDEGAAVELLREMRRVARRGLVVDDIVRSRAGYWGAWILSRLASRNPLTRHDGPLSALRAYTRAEIAELAREAGLTGVRFDAALVYRIALIAGV